MTLTEAFAGRRVLITGHTGFKGAWLAEWLLSLGANVTGYALNPPTSPSLFDALGLGRRVHHVVADIRDRSMLESTFQADKPSVVFHLAAQSLVRRAYESPAETLETNVMGTVNVLDAARACPSVQAVVIVSSDKSYQNVESGLAFRETDPLGGRDPYSVSKACADLIAAAYRASFFEGGAAVASVRAGNVIGGGDWAADRIIPDTVRAVTAGKPVHVRNPDAIRPWQHVLAPLAGYLLLASKMIEGGSEYGGAWNFGPSGERSDHPVRWVVERFLEEWGAGGTWATPPVTGHEPHEAQQLRLDSDKARMRLGWGPAWDSDEAVRRTAAWYRDYYLDPTAARRLVDGQLQAYQAEEVRRSTQLVASSRAMRAHRD